MIINLNTFSLVFSRLRATVLTWRNRRGHEISAIRGGGGGGDTNSLPPETHWSESRAVLAGSRLSAGIFKTCDRISGKQKKKIIMAHPTSIFFTRTFRSLITVKFNYPQFIEPLGLNYFLKNVHIYIYTRTYAYIYLSSRAIEWNEDCYKYFPRLWGR